MKFFAVPFALIAVALLSACGAVKDAADEVSNSINVKGHWLMTESERASKVEKAVERESMVLTFKDGSAAFSPTDSVKGRAVFATLSRCTAGPRPYRSEKNDIVFDAVTGCEAKRISVQRLDADRFKFADPDNGQIVRVFVRIDEARYQALVKATDRKP